MNPVGWSRGCFPHRRSPCNTVYGQMLNKAMKLKDRGIVRFISRSGQTKFIVKENSVLSVFGSELYGMSYDFNMTFQAIFETKAE